MRESLRLTRGEYRALEHFEQKPTAYDIAGFQQRLQDALYVKGMIEARYFHVRHITDKGRRALERRRKNRDAQLARRKK